MEGESSDEEDPNCPTFTGGICGGQIWSKCDHSRNAQCRKRMCSCKRGYCAAKGKCVKQKEEKKKEVKQKGKNGWFGSGNNDDNKKVKQKKEPKEVKGGKGGNDGGGEFEVECKTKTPETCSMFGVA